MGIAGPGFAVVAPAGPGQNGGMEGGVGASKKQRALFVTRGRE